MMVALEQNDEPKNRLRRCNRKLEIYWNHGTLHPLNNRINLLRILGMKLRSCSFSWLGRVIRIVRHL